MHRSIKDLAYRDVLGGELTGKLNANNLSVSVVPQQKGVASIYLNLNSIEFVGPNTLKIAFYIKMTKESLLHLHNMKNWSIFSTINKD